MGNGDFSCLCQLRGRQTCLYPICLIVSSSVVLDIFQKEKKLCEENYVILSCLGDRVISRAVTEFLQAEMVTDKHKWS